MTLWYIESKIGNLVKRYFVNALTEADARKHALISGIQIDFIKEIPAHLDWEEGKLVDWTQ
jgi:hypothetical protein